MELLYLIFGLLLLQGFLSAFKTKLLALILPGANLIFSLLMFFNILALPDFSKVQLFFTSLLSLIIINIPTLIFIAIGYLVKKRQAKVQRDRLRAARAQTLVS
ncbi:MAG: hypothetical protein Q4E36_01690 [Bacillota bacterium]|nr:hypothetical protein [Bacillota bacterium]